MRTTNDRRDSVLRLIQLALVVVASKLILMPRREHADATAPTRQAPATG